MCDPRERVIRLFRLKGAVTCSLRTTDLREENRIEQMLETNLVRKNLQDKGSLRFERCEGVKEEAAAS